MAYTVRFGVDEDAKHLTMLMGLRKRGRLKRLPDKSEVIRVALLLIAEDQELQQRVLDRL